MHDVVGAGSLLAGRYRLESPIGRGAMGVVWRGRDELLDRDVAVKEVRVPSNLAPDDAEIVYQRTLREARTAARLNHPGVVTVFDVVAEGGSPWIVMELVRARALDQIVTEDGPLRPLAAARVGECLLSALAIAHSAGVLHRDVKPSNVLIEAGGRTVLTDFGIATFEGDPALTQVGMVVGTPGFTAPERLRGQPATPASDLWSLGATLFTAVEGRGPFERAGGPAAVMAGIANEPAPRAPSAGPLMPVIEALLRADPRARPDAATVARLLAEAAESAKAGMALPGYPWPYGDTGGSADPADPASLTHQASQAHPAGQAGSASSASAADAAGVVSPASPARDATTAACPVPPGPSMPGGRQAFLASGAFPGSPAPAGGPHLADSADLPAFLDGPAFPGGSPAFPGEPAFPGGSPASPGEPAFRDMPRSGDQPPPSPDLAAPWRRSQGPHPAHPAHPPARSFPRSRPGRALAAGLAALIVLGGGLLGWLAYANSGGQATARGLQLAPDGKATHGGKQAGGAGATAPVGPGHGAAAQDGTNPGTAGTGATGPVSTASTGPAPAASPGPSASQPAAAPAPAGYRWYTVSAASSGATAGFTIAVPDGWQATRQGLITYLTSPSGGGRAEINLTPSLLADPVREARLQRREAIRQGQFPGYVGVITRGTFHDAADAVWRFSWRRPAGRVSVRDLLVSLGASAGEQSYALSMSAPRPDAAAAAAVFRQMLHTFEPVP